MCLAYMYVRVSDLLRTSSRPSSDVLAHEPAFVDSFDWMKCMCFTFSIDAPDEGIRPFFVRVTDECPSICWVHPQAQSQSRIARQGGNTCI